MILDYNTNPDEANELEIIDLATNSPMTMEPPYCDVFYADDEIGVIRMHLRDELGKILLALEKDPTVPITDQAPFVIRDRNGTILNPVCIAWWEEKRKIRIVRKSEMA